MRLLVFVLWTFGDIWLANAACLLPGGIAGNNAGYQYAVAHINGLTYADMAANKLDSPRGSPSVESAVSERLVNTHLAASYFECASKEVTRQEKFTLGDSDEYSQKATGLARQFTIVASGIYGKLADKSRAFGSLIEEAIRNSLSEAEFSIRLAKVTAEYQDLLATVMLVPQAVTSVLVDGQPDSSGHMSRLRITTRERADLVRQIDTAFGKRARRSSEETVPYVDAAATLLREWLTKPGYTPRP